MSAARKAVDALERFPSSDCCHAKANEACDCAVDTVADLSAPLAAVVRAVADRWWWERSSEVDDDGEDCADKLTCALCGEDHWDGEKREHADLCELAQVDAALDALESAAKAQGFHP